MSTKGKINDVDSDIKAFLEYVDSGIIDGNFVEELNEAVDDVKSMKKAVKEFMTFEMILLENRMAGRAEGIAEERENFAYKMLLDGVSIYKIQDWTKLSLERIKEIAIENSITLKVN